MGQVRLNRMAADGPSGAISHGELIALNWFGPGIVAKLTRG